MSGAELADTDQDRYQVLPALSDEEYQALKQDIEENGVQVDVAVDEDGNVIDGHHRVKACDELGIEDYPRTVYPGLSEQEKRDLAYKLNLQRRQVSDTAKIDVAKHYLLNDWEGKETQQEIADKLGCSRSLVSEAKTDVNSKLDVVETTVNGDGGYGDKNGENKSSPTRLRVDSGTEVEKIKTVKEKAESPAEPPEVQDTAKDAWDKIQSGETSPNYAHKEVEKAEAEKEVQEQESPDDENDALVRQQDAVEFFQTVESPDLVIADPPYSTDVDDVGAFAREWVGPMLEAIGDSGRAFVFTGAYPEELQAYLNALSERGALERSEVMVWTYRNTLGQSPKHGYKQNWQSILFIQSDPPIELDAPKTSEQWAVQDVNAPDARFGERHHEWEKPGELIRRLIRHTTDEGDTVIDPFVGTGTTVVEAAELGRRALGSDIDEEMLEIAERRGCERL